MSYLTFEEYQALGGKCTESAFPNLQFEVESKLDYITSNNLSACLKEVETIPEAVKRLEVKLINILQNVNNERDTSLSSYSNGIEVGIDGVVSSGDIKTNGNNRRYNNQLIALCVFCQGWNKHLPRHKPASRRFYRQQYRV